MTDAIPPLSIYLTHFLGLRKKKKSTNIQTDIQVMRSPFNTHSSFQNSRKSTLEIEVNFFLSTNWPRPSTNNSEHVTFVQVIFSTALTGI